MTGFSLRARPAVTPCACPPIAAFASNARELRWADHLLADLASATPATHVAPVRGLALRSSSVGLVVRRAPTAEPWRFGVAAHRATLAVALVAGVAAVGSALAEEPSGADEAASAPTSAVSAAPAPAASAAPAPARPPDLLGLVTGRSVHLALKDGRAVIGEVLHADDDAVVLATEPQGALRTLPRSAIRQIRVLGRRGVDVPEPRSGPERGTGPSGRALVRAGTAVTIPGGLLLGATIAAAAVSPEFLYYGAGHVLAVSGPMLSVGIPLTIIGRDMQKRDRVPSLVMKARPDGAVHLTVAGRF